MSPNDCHQGVLFFIIKNKNKTSFFLLHWLFKNNNTFFEKNNYKTIGDKELSICFENLFQTIYTSVNVQINLEHIIIPEKNIKFN